MINYETCSLYYVHDETSETANGQCDYIFSFVSHKAEDAYGPASFYASRKQTMLLSKMFCKLGTLKHAISLRQLSIQCINRYGIDQNAETPDKNITVLCSNCNPRPLVI